MARKWNTLSHENVLIWSVDISRVGEAGKEWGSQFTDLPSERYSATSPKKTAYKILTLKL